MPIKESAIETETPGTMGFSRVPVYYTDEFVDSSPYELAYSSSIGEYLPYLFVGYFTDQKEFRKWYFSNARRHEEMRKAIIQDLEKPDLGYVYGQLWLDPNTNKGQPLNFTSLELHSEIPDRDVALASFYKAFKPKYLHPFFVVR